MYGIPEKDIPIVLELLNAAVAIMRTEGRECGPMECNQGKVFTRHGREVSLTGWVALQEAIDCRYGALGQGRDRKGEMDARMLRLSHREYVGDPFVVLGEVVSLMAEQADRRAAGLECDMGAAPGVVRVVIEPAAASNDGEPVEFEDAIAPEWSVGKAKGYMEVGAVLSTKDGRSIGNAIVGSLQQGPQCQLAKVYTDAGTMVVLNEQELASLFHAPEWLSDVESHPGWLMHKLKGARKAA